jgi:hypothetical protein
MRLLIMMMRFGLLSGLALGFVGCKERTDCEKICIRVVECRRAPLPGEEVLGVKEPHPDPDCLERCEKNREGFSACEGKAKLCPALLDCAGRE